MHRQGREGSPESNGEEGRRHRNRRHGYRSLAECDVPRGIEQWTHRAWPHCRQDASALHPHSARGPGGRRAEALRPLPRPHRLPLQVATYP